MPKPKLTLDNSRRQSGQSTKNVQQPPGNTPPSQLVTTSAVGQYFYGLPVQANTSGQNVSVVNVPFIPPNLPSASAMPPPLDAPGILTRSPPVDVYHSLQPTLIRKWLEEQYGPGSKPRVAEAKTYLETMASRHLHYRYVLASLCLVYGFETYVPAKPTEDEIRLVSRINSVLLNTNRAMTLAQIRQSLNLKKLNPTRERLCELLEFMSGNDLVNLNRNHAGDIDEDTEVTRTPGNDGTRCISLVWKEPVAITVTRFLLDYCQRYPGSKPSFEEVNRHCKVGYGDFRDCMRAVFGQKNTLKPRTQGSGDVVGNETLAEPQASDGLSTVRVRHKTVHDGTNVTGSKVKKTPLTNVAATDVPAASSGISVIQCGSSNHLPPTRSSFVNRSGSVSVDCTSKTPTQELDALIGEIDELAKPKAISALLGNYDRASGLFWYGQGPHKCLEASLRNLFGKAWLDLPPPGSGQQSAAGELQQACFDEQGRVRKAPGNWPIEQLIVTQRMLDPLAEMLETLPSGFVLYLGDTTRSAAQRDGVNGHFVAMRREQDKWYLIDSLGSGPAKVNLADYLRKLPHGLMAAIPVSQAVMNSPAWRTLQAMAANPRLESLSLVLKFDRTPQDIREWLRRSQLGLGDLGRPDVVAAYLGDTTGQPWGWEPIKLPDIQTPQPRRTDNQSHFGQGNNASGQGQGTNPVDTLLHRLDTSGQDLCVLCLKAPPFHLLTYRRDGNWFCEVEPPSAPGQDLYSPNLIEQPLHQVMAAYLAEVGRVQAEMPLVKRFQPEAVAQRTELDIVLQKPPAATR